MKIVVACSILSLALLVFMVYQAAKQETAIRSYGTRIQTAKQQEQMKENEIVAIKVKLQGIESELSKLRTSEDELKKQIEEAEKNKADSGKAIETCKAEKENKEKKKTELSDTLTKLKEAQQAEKNKAQEEVQALKQQLLARDKAVCVFVDPTKAEGRRLCGL